MRPQALGEAKVADLGNFIGRQEDVARLEVAMNDPAPVRLVDGPRERLDQGGGPLRRPRRAVEPLRQASAFQILELEIGPAVMIAEAVNLHDVRVPQFRDRLRLGQKANRGFVPRVFARQDHLERNVAIQLDFLSLVDDSHAAAAQDTLDRIARDARGCPLREPSRGGRRADLVIHHQGRYAWHRHVRVANRGFTGRHRRPHAGQIAYR